MSPQQLEVRWGRVETDLKDWLSRLPPAWLGGPVAGICALAYYAPELAGPPSTALLARGFFLLRILLPAAWVFHVLFRANRFPLAASLSLSGLAACFYLSYGSCGTGAALVLPMLLAVGYGACWLRSRRVPWLACFGLCLAAFAALALGSFLAGGEGECARYFWVQRPQLYLGFALASLALPAGETALALAVSPAHFVIPRPFHARLFLEEAFGPAFPSGIFRVAKAVLLAYVTATLLDLLPAERGIVLRVLAAHALSIAALTCLAQLGVGLAELAGVRCPSPTWFLPLARSPLDFLRRENAFAFRISRDLAQPALLRRGGELLASVPFFVALSFFAGGWPAVGSLVFWAVRAVCCALAELPVFRRHLRQDRWRSVALTHALMLIPWATLLFVDVPLPP